MSLANKLSLFRILLVPAFAACLLYYRPEQSEWLRYLAAALFLIGILTDAIDGYVARAEKQATRLGAILDPAADKLFLVTAYLSLAIIPTLPAAMRMPAWAPIVVISRDLVIVCGWLIILLVTGKLQTPQPSKLGKVTTALQMVAILFSLMIWPFSTEILWAAMILTGISGVGYLRLGNRLLHP
jgi:CDP-diacylglycerol--glycerol-3-phosphate 3-phosphatidyltransferase